MFTLSVRAGGPIRPPLFRQIYMEDFWVLSARDACVWRGLFSFVRGCWLLSLHIHWRKRWYQPCLGRAVTEEGGRGREMRNANQGGKRKIRPLPVSLPMWVGIRDFFRWFHHLRAACHSASYAVLSVYCKVRVFWGCSIYSLSRLHPCSHVSMALCSSINPPFATSCSQPE